MVLQLCQGASELKIAWAHGNSTNHPCLWWVGINYWQIYGAISFCLALFECCIHSQALLPFKHTCNALCKIQSGRNAPFWKWHSQVYIQNGAPCKLLSLFLALGKTDLMSCKSTSTKSLKVSVSASVSWSFGIIVQCSVCYLKTPCHSGSPLANSLL